MVAHLAASFAIKRRDIQQHLHRIARPGPLRRLAVHHERQHAAWVLQRLIAPEGGGLHGARQLLDRVLQRQIHAHRRRLRPLPLRLHRRLEARQIHREAVLLGDLLGELQRESIGVVQLKCLGAADLLRLGRQHLRQQLLAPLERFQEAGLLPLQLRHNRRPSLQQQREHRRHQGDRRLAHRRQERPVDAQQPPVAHHAPQQTPQDVAAPQVAGAHPIADQLHHGAAVVADHLQGGLAFAIELPILQARQGGRRFDQRQDQIGFVVVRHPLQDLGHPLQAQAGVDVAVRQRCERTFRIAVVLHEHQVVELDKTGVVLQIDSLIAELGFEIEVDLRAGSAGAGGARGPEVVGLIHAHDPLRIHADLVAPDRRRFIIFPEYAHHQLLRLQAKHLRAQLPRPGDRLALEIIAKREIAQHLEERVMARRAAHVLDVVGADALLAARRPRRRPWRLPQEHRLERQHARDRQQHRGVVWHQRGAGHALVAPLLVKAQEGLADLRAGAGAAAGSGGGRCGHGGGRDGSAGAEGPCSHRGPMTGDDRPAMAPLRASLPTAASNASSNAPARSAAEHRGRLRLRSLSWALLAGAAAGALALLALPGGLEAALRAGAAGFFYGLLAFHLQRVDPDDGHLQAGLVGAVCGLRSLAGPLPLPPLPAVPWSALEPLGVAEFLRTAMMEVLRGWLPLWLPLIGSALALHGALRLLPALRP